MSNRFIDRGVENNPALERKNDSIKFIEKTNFPVKEDRLKQAEVAEMFDTTVQTIINWRKKGKVTFLQNWKEYYLFKKSINQTCFSKSRFGESVKKVIIFPNNHFKYY